MHKTVFSLVCFLTACAGTGAFQLENAPAPLRADIDNAERNYRDVAASKAAFLSGCPREQVQTEVLARTQRDIIHGSAWIKNYPAISSLGTVGCDVRYVFELVCKSDNSYTLGGNDPDCQVVQDGSAAQAAASSKDAQVREDEALEAQRQQEKKKQEQSDETR